MSAIAQLDPKALVVLLGLNTHEGDTVVVNREGFALHVRDYYEMGHCMGGVYGRETCAMRVCAGGWI
jgi:hypothetical protein